MQPVRFHARFFRAIVGSILRQGCRFGFRRNCCDGIQSGDDNAESESDRIEAAQEEFYESALKVEDGDEPRYNSAQICSEQVPSSKQRYSGEEHHRRKDGRIEYVQGYFGACCKIGRRGDPKVDADMKSYDENLNYSADNEQDGFHDASPYGYMCISSCFPCLPSLISFAPPAICTLRSAIRDLQSLPFFISHHQSKIFILLSLHHPLGIDVDDHFHVLILRERRGIILLFCLQERTVQR
jgi:hypothetical protein